MDVPDLVSLLFPRCRFSHIHRFPVSLHKELESDIIKCSQAHMTSCFVLCWPVVPPPGRIQFLSVKSNSVLLCWGCPQGLQGPKFFRVRWSSLLEVEGSLPIRDLCKVEINNLQLGQQYFFSVATEDKDGNLSEFVKESVFTGNCLESIVYIFFPTINLFYEVNLNIWRWLFLRSGAATSTFKKRTYRGHSSVLAMDERRKHGGNSTSIPDHHHKPRKRDVCSFHQRLLQDILRFRAWHRVHFLCVNGVERQVEWFSFYYCTHRWDILQTHC